MRSEKLWDVDGLYRSVAFHQPRPCITNTIKSTYDLCALQYNFGLFQPVSPLFQACCNAAETT